MDASAGKGPNKIAKTKCQRTRRIVRIRPRGRKEGYLGDCTVPQITCFLPKCDFANVDIFVLISLLLSHFGFCNWCPSGGPARTHATLGGGSNGHTPAMCETFVLVCFVAFSKAHSPCGGNFENHSEGQGGC